MFNDLDRLKQFISKHFACEPDTYPELKGADEKKRLSFEIRHVGLHFEKTAGKVAAVSEDADHGDIIDLPDLQLNIAKSLINTLRLADLAGMSGEDLVRAIEKQYNDTIE